MKKTKIKRLWHGLASVRDYIVDGAVRAKEELLVDLTGKGESMLLSLEDLGKGKRNKEKFRSKHDGRFYSLVDFKWKPQIEKQKKLL